MSGSDSLYSVEQALLVLEALAECRELGVSELAALLGRPPSGAHRLLSTLLRRGYVQQVPGSRKYRLGVKLFELSAAFVRGLDVRQVARPVLEDLVRTTAETAHLSVFDRGEAVNVDTVESSSPVQVRTWIGTRSAAYATSTGKVLLAFQPADVIERVLAAGLRPHTAYTETDPEALRQELAAIRERGFAINVAGWRDGVAGVAAPVCDAQGAVVAAISLAGPLTRVDDARLVEFADLARQAGADVSARLGWQPPARPTVAPLDVRPTAAGGARAHERPRIPARRNPA